MTNEQIYLGIDEWNALLGIDDSYKAPDALWSILRDKERREELFRKTLELHRYNVDYDWFHEYFQEEHADRAQKKQDFTPNSVATLLSELVSGERKPGDTYYEPCDPIGDFPAHLGGQAFLDAVRHEVAETIVVCDKCGAVLPDGIVFDYSPDYGDICEGCAEVVD